MAGVNSATCPPGTARALRTRSCSSSVLLAVLTSEAAIASGTGSEISMPAGIFKLSAKWSSLEPNMDATIRKPKAMKVAAPQPQTRTTLIIPVPHCFLAKFHMDAAMSPKNASPGIHISTLVTQASGVHRAVAVIVKPPRRQMYTSAGSQRLLKYRVRSFFHHFSSNNNIERTSRKFT
jgi:hypothetical protein